VDQAREVAAGLGGFSGEGALAEDTPADLDAAKVYTPIGDRRRNGGLRPMTSMHIVTTHYYIKTYE
jgi:hypothetical protein